MGFDCLKKLMYEFSFGRNGIRNEHVCCFLCYISSYCFFQRELLAFISKVLQAELQDKQNTISGTNQKPEWWPGELSFSDIQSLWNESKKTCGDVVSRRCRTATLYNKHQNVFSNKF